MAVPPPLPASGMNDRPALRRALRVARSAFALRATAAETDVLVDLLRDEALGAGILGGYVAHRGEPDVGPVLEAARAAGVRIALPRIAGGAMTFAEWDGRATVEGPFGIAEPAAGSELVPDTLLVPLLGFDGDGNRLGQGGGHYDRWLARYPATRTIGVGWSVQRVAALDPAPWDIAMTTIVTETGIVRP